MKVPVLLKMIVSGRDGTATATRKAFLPCTPFDGLWVDGHRVLRADYQTKGSPEWILLLAGGSSTFGDARENLKTFIDVAGWDVDFKEVVRDMRSGAFPIPKPNEMADAG
jgi:hypothetical protein